MELRAWDVEKKAWSEDFFGVTKYGEALILDASTGRAMLSPEDSRLILEIWTGRKDKHGRKIFEGDILLGEFFGMGGRWIEKAIVRCALPEAELYWTNATNDPARQYNSEFDFSHPKFSAEKRREVIGNIHENPELLEGAL